MINVIGTAIRLGYIEDSSHTIVDLDTIRNYPPEKTVLVTTGSQGESMAALSRMAANIHKKIKIMPGDVIVFSSQPIPGNEKAVSNVMNELAEIGATVVFGDTHVSGHACQEDIKLIYSLVQPKYSIPVHGEMCHLRAQAAIARSLGIPSENIFILHSGDVLEIGENSAKIIGKVQTGQFLSTDSVSEMSEILLSETVRDWLRTALSLSS